ncbi:MAG: hypothetical protein A2148_05985 [Chloroflexi bacterium RBG_16_68_14]|nr:MAG: hypothetical protein A2148_05985 [Chloroflexi bacterium RBG_16_68_14]
MESQRVTCGHCGAINAVSVCPCGRAFVLTLAHVEGRPRAFYDLPIQRAPADLPPLDCDLCTARARQEEPRRALTLGLRQRTCPSCHQEFLSEHGL